MDFRFALALPVLLSAAILAGAPAAARPLDKEECAVLSTELKALAEQDIPNAIVKGPTWTLAHMPPAAMPQVRRYLMVEEQLRFRCSGKKPPVLEPQTASSPGDAVVKNSGKAADDSAAEKASALAVRGSAPAEGEGSAQSNEAALPPARSSNPDSTVRRAAPVRHKAAGNKEKNSSLDAAYRQLFPMGR